MSFSWENSTSSQIIWPSQSGGSRPVGCSAFWQTDKQQTTNKTGDSGSAECGSWGTSQKRRQMKARPVLDPQRSARDVVVSRTRSRLFSVWPLSKAEKPLNIQDLTYCNIKVLATSQTKKIVKLKKEKKCEKSVTCHRARINTWKQNTRLNTAENNAAKLR